MIPNKQVVKSYKKYKHDRRPIMRMLNLIGGLACVVIGLLFLWVYFVVDSPLVVMVSIGANAVVVVTAGGFFKKARKPPYRDSYRLLIEWEELTIYTVDCFPVEYEQRVRLVNWAKSELWFLASSVNQVFSKRDLLARQLRTYDPDDPKRISYPDAVIKEVAEGLKRLEESQDKAKDSHRRFLRFWDLVTEDKGLGILKRPEYCNPEKFRRELQG